MIKHGSAPVTRLLPHHLLARILTAVTLTLAVLPGIVIAEATPKLLSEEIAEETPERISAETTEKISEETTEKEKKAWYESSRNFVIHHADNIVQWTDNFFGDERTEQEAAYSTLRLRLEAGWREGSGTEDDISLRGKVHLPGINKRLSLLFSDDDSSEIDNNPAAEAQDTSDDVTLQYRARKKKNYRIDLRGGLRSNGNPKASVRYRYQNNLQENLTGRFTQELYYRGGDGAGTNTRLEFDRTLSEDHVLRWHNRVNWEEEESGTAWNSSVSLDRRLSEEKAISYYISANGRTQPDGLTNSYGLGFRLRKNVLQPWIFLEVQPDYRWVRPTSEDDREGIASLIFRLELVFEKDLQK